MGEETAKSENLRQQLNKQTKTFNRLFNDWERSYSALEQEPTDRYLQQRVRLYARYVGWSMDKIDVLRSKLEALASSPE